VGQVAAELRPMGLRLSEAKTRLTYIDTGFDFLGWRNQRRRKKGHQAGKRYVYTYPSKKSLASIIGKVRQLTRRASHRTLADLLRRLNPVIRGGAPTSATACRNAPSATSTTSPSGGSSAG
jgi:RNA-directed DNA polymerase